VDQLYQKEQMANSGHTLSTLPANHRNAGALNHLPMTSLRVGNSQNVKLWVKGLKSFRKRLAAHCLVRTRRANSKPCPTGIYALYICCDRWAFKRGQMPRPKNRSWRAVSDRSCLLILAFEGNNDNNHGVPSHTPTSPAR
jgi:hypothetical protein